MVKELKKCSSEIFMPISQKRIKGSASLADSNARYIMLSPLLAIVMHTLMNESLIDGDWKVR